MHQLKEDQSLEAEVADEVLKWEEAGQDHEGPCVDGWWQLVKWEDGEVEGHGISQMAGVNKSAHSDV